MNLPLKGSRVLRVFQLLLFFVLVMVSFPVGAQELVKIRLLPERGTIEAGEEIWVGIEQSIKPQWHTYWKNPGDSGASPRLLWSLPEGFEISDIQWPVPYKIPYSPLLNYGYEEQVILLQKLKAPEVLPERALEFEVNAEVLVCKEECIPEFGTYGFTLNDGNEADNAAYLEGAIEKLPGQYEGEAVYGEQDGQFILQFPDIIKSVENIENIDFMPLDWGAVENAAELKTTVDDGMVTLTQQRGERPIEELNGALSGVLAFEKNGERHGYEFSARHDPMLLSPHRDVLVSMGLPLALVFAFLGGVILNLMPCVFPVLSLKALSLVKTAEKSAGQARAHGMAYTAGILVCFLIIAGVIIAFKAAGAQVGWGFQLQSPLVVGLLAYLTFLLGLNLSGFFEIKNSFSSAGGRLAQGGGLSGSFFTGVLATLVATPCSAPFMAGAIGYALVQPAYVSLAVFTALGLGLAFPYLLLSFSPAFQRRLPKPGVWMETFRQFLAFPMFGASVWLVWVLGAQAGINGVLYLLSGMVLLALGIWLWKLKGKKTGGFIAIIAVASIVSAALLVPRQSMENSVAMKDMREAYTSERLEALLEEDDPVFVEMTAAWCITCKVNEAIALNTVSTQQVFQKHHVHYLVGDWTNKNETITAFLERYGRSGVPLYVYFGARQDNGERPEAKVLPQVLTPSIVKRAVEN